jgi:hypothetical protein
MFTKTYEKIKLVCLKFEANLVGTSKTTSTCEICEYVF